MNHNHLNYDWINLIFLAEGVIEEYIIDLLTKNKLLIEKFLPKNEWQLKIENMDGKDKITYSKVDKKLNYQLNEYKNSHFIIVADNIINKEVWFDKKESDKKELIEIFGENYNERITYISFIPTTDILLIISLGHMQEFMNGNIKSAEKFLESKGYAEAEFKSMKFIKKHINEKNIVDICNKLPMNNLDPMQKEKHIICIREILK